MFVYIYNGGVFKKIKNIKNKFYLILEIFGFIFYVFFYIIIKNVKLKNFNFILDCWKFLRGFFFFMKLFIF